MEINSWKMLPFFKIPRTHAWKITPFYFAIWRKYELKEYSVWCLIKTCHVIESGISQKFSKYYDPCSRTNVGPTRSAFEIQSGI